MFARIKKPVKDRYHIKHIGFLFMVFLLGNRGMGDRPSNVPDLIYRFTKVCQLRHACSGRDLDCLIQTFDQ